jgi:hypothetical protein
VTQLARRGGTHDQPQRGPPGPLSALPDWYTSQSSLLELFDQNSCLRASAL